jgi:hypothetical protein
MRFHATFSVHCRIFNRRPITIFTPIPKQGLLLLAPIVRVRGSSVSVARPWAVVRSGCFSDGVSMHTRQRLLPAHPCYAVSNLKQPALPSVANGWAQQEPGVISEAPCKCSSRSRRPIPPVAKLPA